MRLLLILITFIITACNDGGNSVNYAPTNSTVFTKTKAASYLVFSPSEMVISNQNTTAHTSTLTLVNAPLNSVTINFSVSSYALKYSPGFCNLSQAHPSCIVNVNNAAIGGSTGSFYFTATSIGSTIATKNLSVIIAPAISVPRTITVVNRCPFTIYPGISGGAANLTRGSIKPGNCPTDSYDTKSIDPSTGYEICYWKNPTPRDGKYNLKQNESTIFTIPISSLDTVGSMWGGGIMARIKLNDSWVIGDCSGGESPVGNDCAVGVGFNIPETVAEFTLTPDGADTFDVQLINGVTVPIMVTPDNVTPDDGNPYFNGSAGSTKEQIGSQYTLHAANWSFTPGIHGETTSTTYYNYVTGMSTNVDQCSTDSDCNGNPKGPVCGYAANSLTQPNPSYTRVCGYRLAYLTGATIYTLNPSATNTAPFSFDSVLYNVSQSGETPYPNSNANPMHDFYLCNGGAGQSGYQPTTVYPHACGCVNWDEAGIWGPKGIATPTTKCTGTGIGDYKSTTAGIGFNSAWQNEVLPRIYWVKQGCPTCYSYQYDDPSSTFNAYAPKSTSNAANAVNYTITFCPEGKAMPNYIPDGKFSSH